MSAVPGEAESSAAALPRPGASNRTGGALLLTGFVIASVLAYIASPYVSFWFFTRAIKANDRAALESYVDFPSVRQSLKQELRGKLTKGSAGKKDDAFSDLVARLGPSLIDQLVDAFVTPDGLAALITDPAVARDAQARDPSVVAHMQEHRKDLDWSRVKRAAFTGLKDFLVDLQGTKLHFRFTGMRWRLRTVQLAPNE